MSKHEIEGVVVFDRAAPASGPGSEMCHAKCGPGGHIKGRALQLNGAARDPRGSFIRSPEDFILDRVLSDNHNEGRRVRVTVEVLD